MCGLVAIFGNAADLETITKMNDQIIHRGPDDFGYWVDAKAQVALGHRRLSIQDLSELGRQPMNSASGRYKIIFNGEIYNFQKLKELIKEQPLKTGTDTEVIVELFERNGVERTLHLLEGMFSLVVFDTQSRRMYLARDRAGEKPLYYAFIDNSVYIVSDLRSINSIKSASLEINPKAIDFYFTYGFIPLDLTIYKQINKLSPGYYAVVSFKAEEKPHLEIRSYWELPKINFFNKSYDQYLKDLNKSLTEVMDECLIADVPTGVFLSSGIDSTIIAGYAAKMTRKKIHSLNIGFKNKEYDESASAALIAERLGFQHEMIELSTSDLASNAIDAIDTLDMPIADLSIVPTYILSRLARKRFKVALSGDGGDELFGGYNRYSAYSMALNCSPFIMKALSNMEWLNSPKILNRLGNLLGQNNLSDKIHKLKALTLLPDLESYYAAVLAGEITEFNLRAVSDVHQGLDRLMALDFKNYMVDNVLMKVDRASMFNSLEVRSPFLHPRMIEFAATVPTEFKIRGDERKIILKALLKEYLGIKPLRSKRGFTVPAYDLVFSDEILIFLQNKPEKSMELLPTNLQNEWLDSLKAIKDRRFKTLKPERIWKFVVWKRWVEMNRT